MKVGCLLGVMESGEMENLGMACGNDLGKLVEKYHEIIGAQGILKQGKKEVKISEMHLLANNTSGGELKSLRRF